MTHIFCAPTAVGNYTPASASDRDTPAGRANGAAGAFGAGGGGGGHAETGSGEQGAAGGEDQASGQGGQLGMWEWVVMASLEPFPLLRSHSQALNSLGLLE